MLRQTGLVIASISQRKRAVAANVLLVVVATSVALGLAEVGMRATFTLFGIQISRYRPASYYVRGDNHFDRSRFVGHPFLPYVPRSSDARTLILHWPDIDTTVESRYQTNSLGFRTPERPFVKSPTTKRIITLGGSTTWEGPDNEATWPSLLEKRLNAHYRSHGVTVEVINLAVDGGTSAISLEWLALVGVEYAPDLVISYDGVNDFKASFYAGIQPDYRNAMRKFDDSLRAVQRQLPTWAFRSFFVSVLTHQYDRWRNGGAPLDLWAQIFQPLEHLTKTQSSLASIHLYQRNLKLMRGLTAECGGKFIASVPHWVRMTPALAEFDQAMRDFFGLAGIPYLDLEALLPHDDMSIHTDWVHWTVKGLHATADAWFRRIVADDMLELGS